ncbi:putative membrane protein [Propionispora sp. 2/2-37]|uniref:putative polysaccharide biosynthesis protein n=1 Tax=Propionispora sp. 2/2-37 TaxID=1677858 RepID=UPI0006BB8DC9|nr:polysaccharide biosynthesis protein [Propionispora sp. 2/2-37]CUH97579.1 putative membrane protein [Propionispora sp. 2/2-37]
MSNAFLKGTLVLTLGGAIVKITGALNWMILSRVLSAEGIGIYQLAFPIYVLAFTISSAGFPVAISIVTAEKLANYDFKGAKRVFKVSLSVMGITGLVMSLLMYFGADWLIKTQFVRDARAYHSLIALAPAVFFVTLLSSFRGYFQGWQTMTPTAVSQIVEQLVRVVTMIAFASMLLPMGLEYAAAGATFGAAPGAVFALGVLLYYYYKLEKRYQEKLKEQAVQAVQETKRAIIRRIVKLSIPVSLAQMLLPVVAILDLLVVPLRLEVAGFSVERSTELYGYLTGMALPLVNMATILTASLALSLVPAVSEAVALGDRNMVYQRAATAMRISNLITIPSFIGLSLLATPVSQIFYGAPEAGEAVAVMVIGIFFLGMQQVTTGILQGLSHTTIPLVNMVISLLVKVAINWTLVAIPSWGVVGAAWGTVADYAVAALLNLYFVKRYTGFAIDIVETAKMLLAGIAMGGVIHILFGLLTGFNVFFATIAAIAAGGVTYAVILVLTGGVVEQDLRDIPYVGAWLAKFFAVRNWLNK